MLARLKVTLDLVEPPVTRVLLVPLELRLDRLHLTLQAAMGWHQAHLWCFEAIDTRWSDEPGEDFGIVTLDARKTSLADALGDGSTLVYIYDFGDDWVHHLEVEGTEAPQEGVDYPVLVKAVGACPPEDIGGPPGYEEFRAVLADPDHEDHDEVREWHGPFDPSDAEIEILTAQVKRLAKRWKGRPPTRKPKAR